MNKSINTRPVKTAQITKAGVLHKWWIYKGQKIHSGSFLARDDRRITHWQIRNVEDASVRSLHEAKKQIDRAFPREPAN